jgi:hypothetical protein
VLFAQISVSSVQAAQINSKVDRGEDREIEPYPCSLARGVGAMSAGPNSSG